MSKKVFEAPHLLAANEQNAWTAEKGVYKKRRVVDFKNSRKENWELENRHNWGLNQALEIRKFPYQG